ncbi:pleckstrin homology domain-containing family S member 1 isoform X1 [Poecilia latipinna]|uniref:pleckstrin homology domain-containing family S member 1 isoform X1 n=1 Tax=Poecilia latipinna TaxID=48699 RepID=UPI00072E1FB6|nr:PREDICTED: pleckstrin homology domain-containing family S member 1 isoform X1 [Poecilia latipinna]
MAKRDRSASGSSVFYNSITNAQEIRSGYLLKSPPQKRLKSEWKRRFFVLYKSPENNYQLRYYRNAEDRVNPLGAIDMTQISLLYANPQHHQKWEWVQRSFKCSPSCVVYLRAGNRDYFLIAENSSEADGWFTDLFEALKNRPHKFLKSEEISNGQPVIDTISNPLHRRKFSAPEPQVPFLREKEEDENDASKISLPSSLLKLRSFSDPSSKAADGNTEELVEDSSRRPTSEPVNDYDYPKSNRKRASVLRAGSMESLYESMIEFKSILNVSEPNDCKVEVMVNGTLMRSITDVYTKYKAEESPAPISNEAPAENGEDKRQSSDFSTSSSGAVSPDILETNSERRGSDRSLDGVMVDLREFMVNLQGLKNDLTLTEVEGKPSVSGWTGQPQSVCLFHKEDRVVAINDLQTDSVEDFYMLIRKSMKDEVKVTIQRQRGCQALHWSDSPCSG